MAKVERRRNQDGSWAESVDELIRRFNRKFMEDGILREIREREAYKSKGQKRREKKLEQARNAWVLKMKAERHRKY